MDWEATPKQELFLSVEETEVLFGGAAGGGKSDALVIWAALRRMAIPGSWGLYMRRTYPELERTAIARSKEIYPLLGAKYSEKHHRWTFPNGSVQEFGYSERESDVNRYQGAAYADVCWDELTQFSEYQYQYLFSRTRVTKRKGGRTGVKTLIRAASNPGNIGHAWVKSRFVDPAPYGQPFSTEVSLPDGTKQAITRRYIPSTIDDNPHIDRQQYEMMLAALPEDEYRALRHGDWDVFAGQYFKCLNTKVHRVRPFEIPAWWRRFRSLDYGLDATACLWWAVSPEGKEYVYRELYRPDLIASVAAKEILRLSEGEDIAYTVASPDLWSRSKDTGISIEESMTQAGLYGLVRADNRRVPGWMAVYEHLNPYPDLETGELTARLQIFESCTDTWRTMTGLVRDEKNPSDVSDKCEDHLPESLRYGIMSRPPLTVTQDEQNRRNIARLRRIQPSVSGITNY